ncbi:hypothetical protein [Legionella micdadei]|uniref:Uncharacterized protein n=1 Tax=Legionella micdadei TaxID=451 RepID=A0A098GFD0_LEGMI|nr:hypothetical protein [Legionella micdadei]ARG97717.1 hypothetical protein B6N58_08605 [Legionella micdadei]ARG99970.1 hypothetical protein B6V88_05815 [Legionella micdadei]KTD28417.1 hypothetical protein Lmic_1528 [Legionella micdadei]NSL18811.1 hypothetical protein [Legionella micdadei]CEG60695.1 protein of unknown function [Legionella micdadei]
MPELLTKHPDLTLKLLKEAKIPCGTGAQQTILKACPKDQFCSLPSGELCIYGTNQISEMAQIHPVEFLFKPGNLGPLSALILIALVIGIWIGTKF